VIVRREQPADHDAVRELHRTAFARDPVTGVLRSAEAVPEARLVDLLREDAGFLPHLSLVAVDGDDLVGHVLATRGWLEPFGTPVLGLGPVGVRPDRQRRSIGTVLVHAVLAVARRATSGWSRCSAIPPTTSASDSYGRPSWRWSRRKPRGASTSRCDRSPGRRCGARSATPTHFDRL
jgi:predicted N-acetyltransferase YhbS